MLAWWSAMFICRMPQQVAMAAEFVSLFIEYGKACYQVVGVDPESQEISFLRPLKIIGNACKSWPEPVDTACVSRTQHEQQHHEQATNSIELSSLCNVFRGILTAKFSKKT